MVFRLLLVLASTLALAPYPAQSQDYPTKPIRMLIGGAAGGTSDILGRIVNPEVSKYLGQPIVMDIRPGAGGNIAAEIAAKAEPDGYTLFMNYPAFTTNPALYGKLNFDTEKDFAPVTLLVEMPVVLVVHPSTPATSVRELIELAKSRPGKLFFGSSGNGGVGHLVGELFNTTTGVQMVHVPYKGNGPALVDVMTGVLNLTFSDIAGALPYVRSGKMRALAIAAADRSPKLPDTPTMDEAGVKGFRASSWFGVVTTGGTPNAVVTRLNKEFVRALRTPEMQSRLTDMGFVVSGNSPQEFKNFLTYETTKWTKVIKDTGASIK